MTNRHAAQNMHAVGGAADEAKAASPWWVGLIVILIAVLTAMGAVIALVNPAMLVSPHDVIDGATRTYAGYLVSRDAAIALALLALLIKGAKRALGNLMALVGLIQFLDAIMDCVEARWTIAPGVFVLGALCLLAAVRLRRNKYARPEHSIPTAEG